MFNSIRIRLALWFTGVLALVLIVFAVSTYLFLNYTVRRQTDNTLRELSLTFTTLVETERDEKRYSRQDAQVRAIREALEDVRFKNYQIFVFDKQGNLFPTYDRLPDEKNAGAAQITKLAADFSTRSTDSAFFILPAGENNFRVFAQRNAQQEPEFNTFIVHSLEDEEELLDRFRNILLGVVPLCLVLAGFGGYFLARKSLAPVVLMSDSASQISARNLHERLPVKNEKDELGSLATVFNSLLERLEDSFEQQRRFMADASHELRTPLAIVRGESEVTLSKTDRPIEELRESLIIVHDESKRLTKIVEDLFTLARADANQFKTNFTQIYLDEILSNCVRKIQILAEKRNITIELLAGEMLFRGDEQLLHRLFINLLDNAIKYNREGGKITVSGEREADYYRILISDTGRGISSHDQPKIFKRFYRADKARTRRYDTETSGAGLGLSIANWIVGLHDGKLELVSSDENGSTFAVEFSRQNYPTD